MAQSVPSAVQPSPSPASPARRRFCLNGFLLLVAGPAAEPPATQRLLDELSRTGDAGRAASLMEALRTSWRNAAGPAARQQLEDIDAAMANRDFANAGAALDRLLVDHPDFLAARLARAELRWAIGALADSLGDLRLILAAEPRHVDALYLLGLDLLRLDRPREAEAAFAAVLRVDPFNAMARAQILQLRAKEGASRERLVAPTDGQRPILRGTCARAVRAVPGPRSTKWRSAVLPDA